MYSLEKELIEHEGMRLDLYIDTVGKTSIGVGRNLTDKGLRLNEVALMLENDIKEAEAIANQFPWFSGLNHARQTVLINMCFNLGNKIQAFEGMLAALGRKDYTSASLEMLDSKWARQVGIRARQLSERMKLGVY